VQVGWGGELGGKRRFMIVSTAQFRVGGEEGKYARKWRKVGNAVVH
jgi:hypothetical protein